MILDTRDDTTIEELVEEVITQATLRVDMEMGDLSPSCGSEHNNVAKPITLGEWKRAMLYILSRYGVKS